MIKILAIAAMLAGSPFWPITGTTQPDTRETPAFVPFVNPTFGVGMNINAAFSGTPDGVHDGIDSALWTASSIVGAKYTFDSTDQANSGTRSIKTDNPLVGDIMQLARASSINVADYVAMTFAIYIASDWATGDCVSIYGYDTGLAQTVSSSVEIDNYINSFLFGAWQLAVIPITDLAFTELSFDALRLQVDARDGAKSPLFYLDDMQFEQVGTPAMFIAPASAGTILKVDRVRLIMVDNIAATVASGTALGISYDKIMGLSTLANGIAFSFVRDSVATGFSLRQMSDSAFLGGNITSAMSDGTNTMIIIEVPTPVPLVFDSRTGDQTEITIADDLSGMLLFEAALIGRTVEVP